jgi:hypothetical protein
LAAKPKQRSNLADRSVLPAIFGQKVALEKNSRMYRRTGDLISLDSRSFFAGGFLL